MNFRLLKFLTADFLLIVCLTACSGGREQTLTIIATTNVHGFDVILTGCSLKNIHQTEVLKETPRNIILFIGDGLGLTHLHAGMIVSDKPLILEQFPYSGFSKTYSFDNFITGSGASGTAISCGIKTRNGMIGMGPDSTIAVSITELAHKKGIATGIISTSSITHGSQEKRWVAADFSTTDHTAVMVPVFSYGPAAERFSGIHDNTFYFHEFLDLLNIK